MSQHIFQDGNVQVVLGYDRPLDYVFCTIFRDDKMLYSNLSDPLAGTEQQDVDYYVLKLEHFGIAVPEEMFIAVNQDQLDCAGNLVVHYDKTGPLPKGGAQ